MTALERARAYRVTMPGWPELVSIYVAETAGKARHKALSSALEASFDFGYQDFRVVRAPEFDGRVGEASQSGCLGWCDSPENAHGCLAAALGGGA